MRDKRILIIKKRSQTYILMEILLLFPFSIALLNETLGVPWSVRYILDAAYCSLLVYMYLSGRRSNQRLTVWIWLFLTYTMLSYLPQWQSPLYYLWGVRNNFRFYVAFFAFTIFVKISDVESNFSLLDKLFWVNAIVSVYQFVFMGMSGDNLGGLFGVEKGSNGYTNIYFLVIVTSVVVQYLEKQTKLGSCLVKCGVALIIAAMAELKFFFVEFVLVIAMAVLFTKFSWRKLAVIIGTVIGVAGCVSLLTILFPGNENWYNFEWLLEYALSNKGYTSSGDLNRLNAIPRINELWLKNGWQRMFGLGLGNCDTSGYAFLNTPFFQANEHMHYTWRHYAMIYLEMGWIGLVFYFGFFVLVYLAIRKMEKKMDGTALSYCRISRIMCILCAIISVYNSSMRTEAGYMAYFVLAIPFAMQREKRMIG